MTSLDRPVSELMRREVVTLQEGDRLDLADDIMRLGRIRHLPVLDGERLIGVLSSRDLLAASLSRALDFEPLHRRAFMRAVEVKEVMTQDVDTITPDDAAAEAGRRMMRRKIGCLPVVNESGAFVGLLTETDLLRAALGMQPEGEASDVVEPDAEGPGRFDEELEELRRVRDELRLQIHLGKTEATDLWEKLERRFGEAEAQARALARRAEEPVQGVAEAARSLVEEIRSGYRKLRELL
jgi:CBS domain-containing protein